MAQVQITSTRFPSGFASAESFVPMDLNGNVITGGSPAKVSTANTPAISGNTTALAAKSDRTSFTILNLSTSPLFIRLGASASTTVFHEILPGGSAQDDGLGGRYYNNEYSGVVSVAATGTPRYVVTEL